MTQRRSTGAHSTRLPLSRRPAHRRIFFVFVCLITLFAGVIVRLTYLQVVKHDTLAKESSTQRVRTVTLSSNRGSIFDRNGNDLALNIPQQTIWADPSLISDPAQTAWQLAPLLGVPVDVLQQKLTGKNRFVYLQRKASDDVANRIKALNLTGVSMYPEPKRMLAGDSMLSSVIGAVDIDNAGLSGLEKSYEKSLAGTPGRMRVEQDLSGKNIPGGMQALQPAVGGSDLVLTIDRGLQNKVEQSLSDAIVRTTARGGMAIVMDVKSGEILALSNLVNVDPNPASTTTTSSTLIGTATTTKPPDTHVGGPRNGVVEAASHNMAVTDVFEPGSVSKLVTIAGALEAGIVSPTTSFVTPDHMQIYDAKFQDAEPHSTYTWSTTDILTASSNIGTIMIAQRMGKDRLDHFQRQFGYGSKTGLNFPMESTGLVVPPKKYSGTTLATSAIGQGVSTTAMQMLAAYNTIANNGTYVGPKLVRATIDGSGKEHRTPPSQTRRVVSDKTAAQMNLMMQEVVRVGTATAAQVDGYATAGKTGTAKKLSSDNKGYKDGAYFATFAGFAPANDPRFTGIVILDEPTPIYGGLVSAPVFAEISRYLLQTNHITPSTESPADRLGVPLAAPSASSAADESGVAGTTAEKAVAITENANAARTTAPPSTKAAPTTQAKSSTKAPTSTNAAPVTSAPTSTRVPTTPRSPSTAGEH